MLSGLHAGFLHRTVCRTRFVAKDAEVLATATHPESLAEHPCGQGCRYTVYAANFGPRFVFPEHCWEEARAHDGGFPTPQRGAPDCSITGDCHAIVASVCV